MIRIFTGSRNEDNYKRSEKLYDVLIKKIEMYNILSDIKRGHYCNSEDFYDIPCDIRMPRDRLSSTFTIAVFDPFLHFMIN